MSMRDNIHKPHKEAAKSLMCSKTSAGVTTHPVKEVAKKEKLEKAGWKVGSAEEFVGMKKEDKYTQAMQEIVEKAEVLKDSHSTIDDSSKNKMEKIDDKKDKTAKGGSKN